VKFGGINCHRHHSKQVPVLVVLPEESSLEYHPAAKVTLQGEDRRDFSPLSRPLLLMFEVWKFGVFLTRACHFCRTSHQRRL
jgi:hypothetical protein